MIHERDQRPDGGQVTGEILDGLEQIAPTQKSKKILGISAQVARLVSGIVGLFKRK